MNIAALTTDAELKAECERRGVHPDYMGMSPKYWHDCERDVWARYTSTKAELDALKAKYIAATSDGYAELLQKAVVERNMWKDALCKIVAEALAERTK